MSRCPLQEVLESVPIHNIAHNSVNKKTGSANKLLN
jgi:hypothetical protein